VAPSSSSAAIPASPESKAANASSTMARPSVHGIGALVASSGA
jgi:hypothetical protein